MLSAYALFVGGAWLPTYDVSFRIVTLVLTVTGLVVWLVIAARDPFWRPRSVLGPAFVAAFVALIVTTLTSRAPRLSVEYVAWSILLTALYLLLQRLMASAFFRPRLAGFATVACLVVGSGYLIAVLGHWIEWWGIVGRLAPPPLRPGFEGLVFGNPSAVLTAAVLLAAPAAANLWGAGARAAFAVLIVGMTAVVAFLTGSRAGWLALAIAILATGSIWLAAPERRRALASALRSRSARVAALPVGIVAVVVAVLAGPGVFARAAAGGEEGRTAFYLASLRMFESSPVVGTGPGTWAPLRIANTLPTEIDYYIPHAHSLYLQTLAELGIVGVIAGLVVVVVLGRLILTAIGDPEPLRRRMGWAALFATVYFAAHQALDFYANAPAILFAFAVPIAWLDATAPAGVTAAWRPSRARVPAAAPAVGGVVALVAAVAFLGWSESAALEMNAGTRLLDAGDAQAAVAPLRDAVATDPAMPPYHLALGLALANTGDLAGAEPEFLASATADGLPEAWLDLAAVRAMRGDNSGAASALANARVLGDQQPAVELGAGAVALQIGDRETAVTTLTNLLLAYPSVAADPWWNADPDRTEAAGAAFDAAQARGTPAQQFELSLVTGDTAAAANALDRFDDPDTAATYHLILDAWNRDAAAFNELAADATARPFDLVTVDWCARLARRNGDLDAAAGFRTWEKTVGALSDGAGFETRISEERPDRIAGITSLYYGHFTYRRPTPWMQLIDALPHLGFE